jgi:hypothetical protein
VFVAWELVEDRFFRDADYLTLHYLYITRDVASSVRSRLLAAWLSRVAAGDLARQLYRKVRQYQSESSQRTIVGHCTVSRRSRRILSCCPERAPFRNALKARGVRRKCKAASGA